MVCPGDLKCLKLETEPATDRRSGAAKGELSPLGNAWKVPDDRFLHHPRVVARMQRKVDGDIKGSVRENRPGEDGVEGGPVEGGDGRCVQDQHGHGQRLQMWRAQLRKQRGRPCDASGDDETVDFQRTEVDVVIQARQLL